MRKISLIGTVVAALLVLEGNGLAVAESPRSVQILVKEGRATSCLILPDQVAPGVEALCREWIARVKRSTGAEIPLYRESAAPAKSPDIVRIYVGETQSALDAGLTGATLPDETYRLVHRDGAVYLIASEAKAVHPVQAISAPLRWGLNRLQEEGLGVRFLWPGELGTWVPQRTEFEIAARDIFYQPPLALRVLRMPRTGANSKDPALKKEYREGIEWAQNHMAGRRDSFLFGHAFIHWWDRYSKEKPDLFAQTPEGVESPITGMKPEFVKLRLSNPEVVETIAREYQEAGAPKYWNICPNDGANFDVAPATLAWDEPKGQSLMDIWKGSLQSNLTARYVHFWNLVSERLREINPDVSVVTYAYWSYRHAPSANQKLTGKTIVGIVDGWDAFDTWEGWRNAGAELSLRPNWGYYSAGAPTVWADEIVKFMSFAHRHGLISFDYDQMAGHWATEGLNNYVLARMMNYPDLTADEIVAEYSEAFGAAAPKVRDYFRYWQQRGTEFGYPIPAGGTTGPNVGKYGELQKTGAISDNYFHAPYAALPLLYTDEVLAPAFAILNEAREMVSPDSEEYKRVEFLRAGLNHHRMMRDTVALGIKIRDGKADEKDQKSFRHASEELERFRTRRVFDHLVWPYVSHIERRFKAPIHPANVKARAVDTITIE